KVIPILPQSAAHECRGLRHEVSAEACESQRHLRWRFWEFCSHRIRDLELTLDRVIQRGRRSAHVLCCSTCGSGKLDRQARTVIHIADKIQADMCIAKDT